MATQSPRRVIKFAHTSRGEMARGPDIVPIAPATRQWAWGGATGRNISVCIIDSGVDAAHPAIGGRVRSYRIAGSGNGEGDGVEPDDAGDVAGHGTACAGIVRRLAPDCEIVSIKVLGDGLRGNGYALIVALNWAIEQRMRIINLSLSTRKAEWKEILRDAAERAYFAGLTIVSSAHNSPVESYPWRFPSVLSVGSHASGEAEYFETNPDPPVDFFAPGVQVEVAWLHGGTSRASGNSFATPYISGLCARILERHPAFRTVQVKQTLAAIADNTRWDE
jgi:subtilisin